MWRGVLRKASRGHHERGGNFARRARGRCCHFCQRLSCDGSGIGNCGTARCEGRAVGKADSVRRRGLFTRAATTVFQGLCVAASTPPTLPRTKRASNRIGLARMHAVHGARSAFICVQACSPSILDTITTGISTVWRCSASILRRPAPSSITTRLRPPALLILRALAKKLQPPRRTRTCAPTTFHANQIQH